jgi:hypothetical protein
MEVHILSAHALVEVEEEEEEEDDFILSMCLPNNFY